MTSSIPSVTDWQKYIKLDPKYNQHPAKKQRIVDFFDRLVKTSAGQILLTDIRNRSIYKYKFNLTDTVLYDYIEPLFIKYSDEIGNDYLGKFKPNTKNITIHDDAFQNSTLTKNRDGSSYLFEQTMMHEIVHYLLDNNKSYNAAVRSANHQRGFYIKLAATAATYAFQRGKISSFDYDYIMAPFKNISGFDDEYHTQAVANDFFNLTHQSEKSVDYLFPVKTKSGVNAFDYSKPVPSASAEDLARLRQGLQSSGNAIISDKKALEVIAEVKRRAIEKGVSSDAEFKHLEIVLKSQLGKARHKNASAYEDMEIEYNDQGIFIGISTYQIDEKTGDRKLTSSSVITYAKNPDGSYKRNPDNSLIPETIKSVDSGITTISTHKAGTLKIIDIDIVLEGNPLPFDFSDIGGLLGQQLGYRLAGGNVVAGVVSSAFLQTLGNNLGDTLDGLFSLSSARANGLNDVLNKSFKKFGDELLGNLTSAGVGAVSSYLIAELVNAIGIDGFAGEVANSAGGAIIGQIASNLVAMAGSNPPTGLTAFSNVGGALAGAAGSFIGTKLASLVWQPGTIGGQIGSAVGSALGVIAAKEFGLFGAIIGGPLGAVVGAAIGAFVGFLLGGLIGSVFGGTPRSGADAQWDDVQGKFIVTNVYSRKGGSKDAARSLASVAAETFNDVLEATGGRLARPGDVTAGNYGMRKSDYVYRPTSTEDSNLITYRVSTKDKDAFAKITNYGIYQGLTDPDFQIIGGSNYIKRAVYATLEIGGVSATNFDQAALFGNIASAQAYESYLSNSAVINAIVAAESDSVFAIETAINLARAVELGLTKRHRSDWFGGYNALLTEAGTNAARVEFGYDYDAFSGQISRIIGVGDYVIGDTIDIAGQTTIEAGAGADIIDLRSGKLANQIGYTVNGTLNNDIAVSGADFTALSSSVSFAAGALRSSVTVTIANDGVAEAHENFIASLSNAPNMRIMGGDAVATIIDGAAALPSLMVGDSFAWEDDGFAIFRLSLSKAANVAITVALALANDKASGGGVDYGAVGAGNVQVSADGVTWVNATSATFAAGATELFVRTAVVADNVPNPAYVAPDFDPETGQAIGGNGEPAFLNVEGNERFTLSATVTAGASALANGGAAVSGTGTIVDGVGNEPLVWIDHVVVDEASGQARFVLSRSRALAAATTVAFATADRKVLDIDIAATVDGGDGNDTIYANDNDAPEYAARIVA
jgi:hypothetical protein